MDPRGYGLPNYPGHPSYPRAHHGGIEPDAPRNYHDIPREFSLWDLSLSDDQRTEDMAHWVRRSKKHSPRVSGGGGREDKHPEAKKPVTAQSLGIDTVLRNLNHEVSASSKMFQALVQCFEVDVEPLRDWAEDYTLDTVWRNKVKDKVFREKRDRARFEGVAARISGSRAAVEGAIKSAKALKEAWDDKHANERQIRTAKKAIVFCDGIIDLAERATNGGDGTEQTSEPRKPKSSAKKSKGEEPGRDAWGGFDEGLEEGNGAEEQENATSSFDPQDQPPKNTSDNQGSEGW